MGALLKNVENSASKEMEYHCQGQRALSVDQDSTSAHSADGMPEPPTGCHILHQVILSLI